MALHRAGQAYAERLRRKFQRPDGRRAVEREPVFGLDHARSAIAEWREDFNTARPHSSLGYQTPAAYAEVITATGSDAVLIEGSAPPPVAQPAPRGVTETAKALIVTG
jgi:putative transposase